ncbi:hypothetical protein JW960_12355 [candidate division KSB1 bacterium]|nr:hypothetical protein [candidate division KSB1 bacterium]
MRIYAMLLVLLISSASHAEIMCYRLEQGDEISMLEWHENQITANNIEIKSINKTSDITHNLMCDSTYDCRSWTYHNAELNINLEFEKQQNRIICQGIFEGNTVYKEFDTVGYKWLQFHGFALESFLKSSEDEIEFISILPDKMKLYKLRARKQQTETIDVDGQTMRAICVNVSLTGFMSRLGHVSYWFRDTDHRFVKFETQVKVPGYPKSTYQLIHSELSTERTAHILP